MKPASFFPSWRRVPAMRWFLRRVILAAALAVGFLPASRANAARVRYHYVPAGPPEQSGAAQAGSGERWRFGWEAYDCPAPRPTCFATFRHPDTCRSITLPLRLPEGTPQMEYKTDRVIYDYSGYMVEVHFLSDGSADVIYSSGFLGRPP
jgi:hypothetical protein